MLPLMARMSSLSSQIIAIITITAITTGRTMRFLSSHHSWSLLRFTAVTFVTCGLMARAPLPVYNLFRFFFCFAIYLSVAQIKTPLGLWGGSGVFVERLRVSPLEGERSVSIQVGDLQCSSLLQSQVLLHQ